MFDWETHLDVLHHGSFLGVELGAVGTLEHVNLLLGQVSVKVHVKQGLLGKDRVAHHTLVDHPAKK